MAKEEKKTSLSMPVTEKTVPVAKKAGPAGEKADFIVGDLVKTIASIEGMPPGTKGLVDAVQFDGGVFCVKILEGIKADEVIRIKADGLQRIRTKDKLEKDKEALKELAK